MSHTRKKRRPLSVYDKHILALIEKYESATGLSGADLSDVAWWAYRAGEWEPPESHPVRVLQRHLARACQRECITDDNGEPVRRRYAFKDEASQQTFWVTIEKATPEQIRLSSQDARNGALGIVLQIDRNLNHYNKHYNPGDQILMSFNFDIDVSERHLPDEYPDAPPEES